MADSEKLRLVRCPKCENLLTELADYSVYQCGGCGAVLRATNKTGGSCSLSEKSDEGRVEGDAAKSEYSSEKRVVDSSGVSDVDVKSNSGSLYGEGDREKENNGYKRSQNQTKVTDDKEVVEKGHDNGIVQDELDKPSGREHESSKYQIGSTKVTNVSGRRSDWQTRERGEVERFLRQPRTDVEGVRFSTSNYLDEGPSNGYSNFSHGYGEPWRNREETCGANRVQYLEQDRAELLRKLDELKDQLSQSCNVVNNPKEKAPLDGRMIPPDPYGGTNTWFPGSSSSGLNRSSMQFFEPNKHVSGPSYFNHHPDPFAYTNGHEMAMHSLHPPMHELKHIPGYGDPFGSQMPRRVPPGLPHQFSQPPSRPYFSGHYVDPSANSFDPYTYHPVRHQPSCSCFHCYENKRRASAPAPAPAPAAPTDFGNNRFPDVPNNPMLYRHEIPGAFGSHVHNSRTTIPPVNFNETQFHTRWPSDINSEMGGFVRCRPQKVMLASGAHRCHPVAGGAPFITCHNCFELLQLPKKALVLVKRHQQKVRCGSCSSVISFAVINRKLVLSLESETMQFSTEVYDSSNEFLRNRTQHSHVHGNLTGANFSSDDYDNSGYDFHSVDREPASLDTDPSLNSNKPQEMQSFHSSSPSTSEDDKSPQVLDMEVTNSVQPPIKATLSPPPRGSPLQDYFDYSSNNHAVNRFGKGNRSSRSEQEKVKINKVTSRQNSLKEAAVATEMEVSFNDYTNTGVSQDSGDTSRENDQPRSNKGSESFFANIKKSFKDFSRSNQVGERGKSSVTVNGHIIPDRVLKKAEKLAGPIQPGEYWYDIRAGFWGVMGGPCLGIIPPFIEEFDNPMPENCASGNTGVFVNGRELHKKDLDLLGSRGLPSERDRSYIIEISGRVLDEDTGEELDSLGKLAPTVEKVKHGFGMKVRRVSA
ncbi:Extra-large G-like protein [Quillaja saponaria]|uniref:Extra-large G-like protein n=1 Tax=Quillaja saponaria TaxID=32244 RepID=A0AAD7PPP3_QUISA|nr:Extra-large G-like protein [Quillaja saponaria]